MNRLLVLALLGWLLAGVATCFAILILLGGLVAPAVLALACALNACFVSGRLYERAFR